jgi:hypothetical protein
MLDVVSSNGPHYGREANLFLTDSGNLSVGKAIGVKSGHLPQSGSPSA